MSDFTEARVYLEELPHVLDPAAKLRTSVRVVLAKVDELEGAIRRHRARKDDDRCWIDDLDLYRVLGDGVQPDTKLPCKGDFLQSCARFWEQRRRPIDLGHDPNRMTLAQLEARVEQLEAENHRLRMEKMKAGIPGASRPAGQDAPASDPGSEAAMDSDLKRRLDDMAWDLRAGRTVILQPGDADLIARAVVDAEEFDDQVEFLKEELRGAEAQIDRLEARIEELEDKARKDSKLRTSLKLLERD